jgi:small redox-active disulfide protein 2
VKKLQILGTGCAKCNKLAEIVENTARENLDDFELEKVTEIDRITSFHVMSTPALVVDGVVKASGRIPTLDEIKEMIA